jgi:hypothetical protein
MPKKSGNTTPCRICGVAHQSTTAMLKCERAERTRTGHKLGVHRKHIN